MLGLPGRWSLLPVLCGMLLTGSALAAELPDCGPLRAAIADLAATFPDRYPRAQQYLTRLDRLQRDARAAGPAEARQLQARWESLRREALVANPLVSAAPLLFVVRKQYRPDHHNTETMFQTGEINTGSFQGGGALKTIDLRTGQTKTLLELLDGIARDPDVSFDGRKVLLSLRRNRADDYHLYEINADGSGLVQLTFGSGLSDIDPIYLPSGQICFTSTREPKYCMCNRHIMGNLYTMDADGANIQQIGHSTLHEGHAALLPDGRVLYDRWEYVDRNFGDAQGVWTVNPDGTNPGIYWKNHTPSPGAVLDARAIPGREQILCTFSSCHDRPWGALAIVDRRRGLDLKAPVLRTWPAEALDLVGVGGYDTFKQLRVKYEDPFPLSANYFLCARMTGQGEQMGIYLLDLSGNEILLHVEGAGCYDPMPLAPRAKPPVIPPRIDLAQHEGYFYVADVYRGTGMEQVARGTVKSLRVVESPEKRFWTQQNWQGSGTQAPGMAWDDFSNKRILGTVPVAPDGSAYFAVPADTFVYFQLLDKRGMMIQSMRSGTIVRPGEISGCMGCHEERRVAAVAYRLPAAVQRRPSPLEPWYGPPRKFNYLAEVQPVLDKHCVACHDYGQPAGKKLNLAGDQGLIFNTSYVELRSKNYVRVIGAGPAPVQRPMSWGSHVSPLARFVLDGHGDAEIDRQVRLDRESRDRLITWIDINAPYYPEYATAYSDNLYGRAPLGAAQVDRLSQLTGLKLTEQRFCAAVSFSRPPLSPCLAPLAGRAAPAYQEALAIIRAGQRRLIEQPAADMSNFRLVSRPEIDRQAKYEARRKIEAQMRQAIANGQKQYDQ